MKITYADKFKMGNFILLFILVDILTCSNLKSQTKRLFSESEIKNDLKYLHDHLESADYHLYANTPKEKFEKLYNKINDSINDSLSLIEVYRLFLPYVALSKIVHCNINLPVSEYVNYLKQDGTLFPFNTCFYNKKVYIKDNYSGNKEIKPGDELLSINDVPINKILNDLYHFVSGENQYSINSTIDYLKFSRLYWLIYGRADSFSVVVKNSKGVNKKYFVNSITAKEFEGKMRKTAPLVRNDRGFKFIGNIAYLRPGPFYNPSNKFFSNKSFYIGQFENFLDSCFYEIKKNKSTNLIVDLRNDPGGMSRFGMLLVSYFANSPFKSDITVTYKTSRTTKSGLQNIAGSVLSGNDLLLKRELLAHKNGSTCDFTSSTIYRPKNDSIRFKGKVYVLINRYTFSEAIAASALIQDYKFATLIGENTPNAATMYASVQQFKLPNTHLEVIYPRAYLERRNKDASLVTVVPGIKVQPNPLTKKDEILDYALSLIKKGSN